MALTLYGLKNCDGCRKARAWLDSHAAAYAFHDLRIDGLAGTRLDHWLVAPGWETLLNRRSTTWRQLPEADKSGLDAIRARQLMLAHPTLIKRPILEGKNLLQVGFSAAQYAAALGAAKV